ncbi:MAG: flavin reductase family protein [Phycisphaerales bacterium]|nr:MAG: flavin reductase family protein [Phycisphaerales bacterium]
MKKSLGAKTIVYPTPVFVVGSYDTEGRPNIMTASWGGVCCSQPPSLAVSIRKERHSYENIIASGGFTVNVPSVAQVSAADYAGIYSGRDEDKFAALGLTPVRSDLVNAPYIEEFPLILECALRQTVEIGIHTQFIGEILDVKIDPEMLDDDGNPDPAKIRPFAYAPGEGGYWAIGERVGQSFSAGKKQADG